MTPDERNLLSRFLQDLGQSRGGLKDAEASDMIERTLRANPDAAYLLVQHALIADQALHAAQDRIGQLEAERRGGQGQGGGSFLGGGGSPWAAQGAAPSPAYAAQPQYAPQAQYAPQPGYGQAPPQPRGGILGGLFGGGQSSAAPAQPGGFGSFLRQAGTTAAGVAGGQFLFSGLSNMFGGGHGEGFGGYGERPENVTINEYGGDGGGQGFDPGYDDGGGFDDGGGYDDGGMN